MSTTFKPLADRVLIEPAPAEQTTASGIIIPDSAKEKPLKGKIIAAGEGKKDEPMASLFTPNKKWNLRITALHNNKNTFRTSLTAGPYSQLGLSPGMIGNMRTSMLPH